MRYYGLTALFLVVCCFYSSCAVMVVNLNGLWSVANSSGPVMHGPVPGSMYTALMNAGQMGDPYYRKNDGAYRWVARDDWTFSRNFTVTPTLLNQIDVVLVCEGLDTVASVYINGHLVGSSVNMFVRYVYDIKSALKAGENTIEVRFQSAVVYTEMRFQAQNYTIPPASLVPEYHGVNNVNLIRKMQCSFSWDWGPSYPAQGIWKDIYIEGFQSASIRDITTETTKNPDGSWILKVEVFTEVPTGSSVPGNMEIKLENTTVTRSIPVTLTPGNSTVKFGINIALSEGIKPWWPNGYGNQSLYNLSVFFHDQHGSMSNKKIRIGFRTVELVQDYVSANKSQGRTFYFRINGRPVYFKGSNWIPADSILERVTHDRLYNYLQSTADAHMNVLRVWGGGVYESDDFYAIADELGIMIWQDFMFACAMYPTDKEFLQTVKEEVTHQLRRLKHHPSIVVLSGNNENEKALVQSWYNTDIDFKRYKADYLTLYVDTIASIVKVEDTSRPFLTSSPSNGIETVEEGYVAKQPWDTLYGDIHEYKYLVPFFEPSQYRIPRFSSEYGLQSFPSYESLKPVYAELDMDYWGDLNEWRNHHPFGYIEMMAETIMYMKLPNCPDRKQRFKDQIYVTQINQAVGMKTETEHYRRWQNRLDSKGQGQTMGALYWMLADIWQAPTWASLEYGGKWKMLHYFAKNFFSPTLISPVLEEGDIDVYVIMDELEMKEIRHPVDYTLKFHPKENPRPFNIFDLSTYTSTDVKNRRNDISLGDSVDQVESSIRAATRTDDFSGTLYIEMYSWDSLTALHTWNIPITVNTTAESVYRGNVDAMMKDAGCVRTDNCFLNFHFGDPVNGPTNWIPLSVFNAAQGLQKANITVTDVAAGTKSNQFAITIVTDAIAPFVWLNAFGVQGRFSDNGFLMNRNTMTLTFHAWESVTVETLKSSLSVMSLMDVYY